MSLKATEQRIAAARKSGGKMSKGIRKALKGFEQALNDAELDLTEQILQSVMEDPTRFTAALNNVSAHGEVFLRSGFSLGNDDKLLQEWFVGVNKLAQVAAEIKKRNQKA